MRFGLVADAWGVIQHAFNLVQQKVTQWRATGLACSTFGKGTRVCAMVRVSVRSQGTSAYMYLQFVLLCMPATYLLHTALLQRSHTLSCDVLQYDQGDSSIRRCRSDLLCTLRGVLENMVPYMASATCYVPELHLSEKSCERLAGSLGLMTVQQVCQLCCSLQLFPTCGIHEGLHNPLF